ncbi:hypothetical protein [Microbacterium halophytorum]|uniref:hypothetical protein n=1 Tax=Microbacterium halophytorum TaxID=2067568 RepID=UPI001319F8CE|nr:hypothetical protein [Microbacterium halophytorum]
MLTASFVISEDGEESTRNALRRSLPAGARKLHWTNLDPARQGKVVSDLLGLSLMHFVAVRKTTIHETPERSRRACIEVLLYELSQVGVDRAVFESRGKSDDVRDRKMLDALRNKRVVDRNFRIDHMPGPAEPLLWIADAVCGAVCESIQNGGEHGFERQAWILPTNQGY